MASIRVTKKAFKKVANLMENTMKKKIKQQLNPKTSKFRTGNLIKNLNVGTKFDENKGMFSFILNMPFYGMFFDAGVLGSSSPVGKRKYLGTQAVPNQKSFYDMGRFKSKTVGARNLPFPLAANIAYFGLEPKPFINQGIDVSFEQVVEQVGPDFADEIFDAVKELGKKTITI